MGEITVTVPQLIALAIAVAVGMRLLAQLVRWWVIGAVLALVLLLDFATSTGGGAT